MIRAYVGKFGHGKTLSMSYDAMEVMVHQNRRVISNTPIRFTNRDQFFGPRVRPFEAEFYPNGDDFLHALITQENALFLIDEAAIFLPNIYWSKMKPELLAKFHQQRHYNADIWFTSRGFGNPIKRLREMTDHVYMCHKHNLFYLPDIVIPKATKPPLENISIPYWRNRIPHEVLFSIYWPTIFTQDIFEPEYFSHQANRKNYDRYYLGHRTLYPVQSKRVYAAFSTNYSIGYSALVKLNPSLVRQPGKILERIARQEMTPDVDVEESEVVKDETKKTK